MTHATIVLTPRQRAIAALIAAGRTNAEIGWELGIALQTVKNHINQMFLRLRMTNRVQAAIWASHQDGLTSSASDEASR